VLTRLNWLLVALLVVHAPVWGLRSDFYTQMPLFNYDYLLALSVMVIQPFFGLLTLMIAYALTWLMISVWTYRFKSWMDFFDSREMISTIDWPSFFSARSLMVLFVFVMGLVAAFGCVNRATHGVPAGLQTRLRMCWLYLLVGGLVCGADLLNGTSDFFSARVMQFPANIASSSAYTVQKDWRLQADAVQNMTTLPLNESLLGQFDLIGYATTHPQRSILLIAFESLGVPEHADLNAWLQRQVQVSSEYRLTSLELPFKGSTTSAELRHLCGLQGSYVGLTDKLAANCLPRVFQQKGWQVVGYHGFTEKMFNRSVWWPMIGIDESNFIESSELSDLPRCGGMFNGVCDQAVLMKALQRTEQPQTLVYWLTLQTHLPVQRDHAVPDDLLLLCAAAKVSHDVCAHLASVGAVLAQTVQLADVMPANHKPLLVIFGDHAPPFMKSDERLAFKQTRVPLFVLEPMR